MRRIILACAALLAASTAAAQQFPNRPIRFIVPAAAGGAGDIFARTLGQKMGESLGQTFVIDNRPGANLIIGTDMVAKAPPDGHTILMANNAAFAFNPHLYPKLPYDPLKDFAPVTQGTYYGYVLIVHPGVPAKSVQELVALARTRGLSYGSSGIGGVNHIAGAFFAMRAGVNLTHVPYKGSAPALTDLLAGQLTLMFDTPITAIPQIRAGKVRALAFTGKRRAPQFQDVATLDELGYKGFEVSAWQGIVAPAGTPRPVIDILYREAARALKLPDVIDRLATQGGNELVGSTPDEYVATIRREFAEYGKLIREAGIKPD
jgi:tripartite-type tricarboxylate transporter receptor subunit TctC